MNNIVSNFNQILEFARKEQVPVEKKRAVIREYLQSKFIAHLYVQPKSNKLSFIGGTGLRLLRNLNRFSEDLDFDNLGLSDLEIKSLIDEVVRKFKAESIGVEVKSTIKEFKNYHEFKFPNLLIDLGITTDPREKLMVKFDYSDTWKAQKPEIILLNKYGFTENVVTNPLNQVLVQKLSAYLNRKMTQPRDLYDIVWLYSKGARVDQDFVNANGLNNLIENALTKCKKEGVSATFKNKLQPFLFNEEDVNRLNLFESTLRLV